MTANDRETTTIKWVPCPRAAGKIRQPVTFRVTLRAAEVYLFVGGSDGDFVTPMRRVTETDQFERTLRLTPGRYRYRYYASDGDTTVYVSPADVEEVPPAMDGMNAVLEVRADRLNGRRH